MVIAVCTSIHTHSAAFNDSVRWSTDETTNRTKKKKNYLFKMPHGTSDIRIKLVNKENLHHLKYTHKTKTLLLINAHVRRKVFDFDMLRTSEIRIKPWTLGTFPKADLLIPLDASILQRTLLHYQRDGTWLYTFLVELVRSVCVCCRCSVPLRKAVIAARYI